MGLSVYKWMVLSQNLSQLTLGCLRVSILGPLLFLLHINDLPQSVSSSVRLFADDCLLYKTIRSIDDTLILQRYLHAV